MRILIGILQSFKMSRSKGCATAENIPECVQNLENCMPKLEIYAFQPFFFSFFFTIPTYYMVLCVPFTLFLAQNFKTKVWTTQKKINF